MLELGTLFKQEQKEMKSIFDILYTFTGLFFACVFSLYFNSIVCEQYSFFVAGEKCTEV